MRNSRGQNGVTLVELMIALAMSTIVVGAGYAVLVSSNQAALVNERVVQLQQNARIAMEVITHDLKTAGFGMMGLTSAVTTGGNTCNFGIVPVDNTAAGNDTGPDSVRLVVPVLLSTLQTQVTGGAGTVSLVLQPGSLASFISQGFGAAGSAISMDGHYASGVTAAVPDTITLSSAVGGKEVFPIGTPVYWLQCITYAVSNNAVTCGGSAPCLLRAGVPVVEGIEDLQLAYGCDGCVGVAGATVDDGLIDDQNASNSFDAADFVSNNNWTTAPMTPTAIRLVRVTIVARQLQVEIRAGDMGVANNTPAPLQVEDHNHANGVFAGGDLGAQTALTTYLQTRRRVITRTVQLRNMGLL